MNVDRDAIRARAVRMAQGGYTDVSPQVDMLGSDCLALLAEIDLLRDLLTWHATPAFEEGHKRVLVLTDDGKEEPGDKCWFCDEPWPCPTEQAWTALHPEEAS